MVMVTVMAMVTAMVMARVMATVMGILLGIPLGIMKTATLVRKNLCLKNCLRKNNAVDRYPFVGC